MGKLTNRQTAAINAVAETMLHFDCMNSGRTHRRSVLLSLERLGFVEIVTAYVCDGDGVPKQPERERDGFALTAKGKKLVKDSWKGWSR